MYLNNTALSQCEFIYKNKRQPTLQANSKFGLWYTYTSTDTHPYPYPYPYPYPDTHPYPYPYPYPYPMYGYGYMDMDMDMDMDVDMDMDMDIDVYHRPNLELVCNVGSRLLRYSIKRIWGFL